MTTTSVYDLVSEARSIRVFDRTRTLGEATLTRLVECARLCPSAANLQPLKYRLCFERSEADALLPLTRWAGYLKDVVLPPENKGPSDFIVICHDTNVAPVTAYSSIDVGIAAQSINLAAAEMGFGCCMIGSFDKAALSELFGLESHLVPILVLALGTPDEKPTLCSVTDGDIKYFRDEADRHFVPKRSIEEIIVK